MLNNTIYTITRDKEKYSIIPTFIDGAKESTIPSLGKFGRRTNFLINTIVSIASISWPHFFFMMLRSVLFFTLRNINLKGPIPYYYL